MNLRVLIIPDKFKGTLTSQEAAAAIAAGWARGRPGDELKTVPMTDGGDGFGEVFGRLLQARPRKVATFDASGGPCSSTWWYSRETRTAIIESANVIGLAMLPPRVPGGRKRPMGLDTYGLASPFLAALQAKARLCLVGIGGSATNDGGFGLARGLGWTFQSGDGKEITRFSKLDRLEAIQPPRQSLPCEVRAAVDVTNPLLGPLGCSRVFGPQKGLRPNEMEKAEACLGRLAEVTARVVGKDFQNEPGAGAAGGLGFGLQAFLGAKPVAGFDLFSQIVELPKLLEKADLVITGEGALDASSVMGKAAGSLATLCQRSGLPCFALAGVADLPAELRGRFHRVGALTDLTTSGEARARPARWLKVLAEKTAREWPAKN